MESPRLQTMQNQRRYYAALLAALLLHVSLLGLGSREQKNVLGVTSVSPSKIRLAPAQEIKAKNITSRPKTQSAATAKKVLDSTHTAPEETKTLETDSKVARYSALLPQNALSAFDEESDSSAGSTPSLIQGKKLSPEFQRPADSLVSYILLPVGWRQTTTSAKATLRLSIDDEDTLWLNSLYGDPMLRAILSDALTRKGTKEYLFTLMKSQDRRDFTVILKFVPQIGAYRALNTEAVVHEDGIEIVKTLPPPMRDFGGRDVYDPDAERAKRREKVEIERLQSLPAYARTLQGEVLQLNRS